jgi:hypothetical protein
MRLTRERAYLMGRDMIWPSVGRLYLDSFQRASKEQTITQAAIVPLRLASHPHHLHKWQRPSHSHAT